jgi:hypothetical protein
MRKKIFSFLCVLLFAKALYAQQSKQTNAINRFADITATIGQSQGSMAASVVNNWKTGDKKKFELGLGLRLTSYFGTKKDYITAPAKLSRSTTFPFAIVFAGQEIQNWDTLTVQRPFTQSLNITADIGYNFTSKLYGGVNIDLIGLTLGRNSSAIFTSDGVTVTETNSKPSSFNLLLTGDNDLGTLNSEFFIKYKLNNKWSAKVVYQFLFNEYKTTTVFQTAPDGTVVDRFRNKVNAFGAGVSYNF